MDEDRISRIANLVESSDGRNEVGRFETCVCGTVCFESVC